MAASRRRVLQAAAVVGAVGAVLGPAAATAEAGDDTKIRWDIVSVDAAFNVRAGGHASAKADDGSMITLTGSGTFRTSPGHPQAVTGGGTWRTSGGAVGAHSGTYAVTGFVDFDQAPGTFPTFATDRVGDSADARAGLAKLRVAYSNGQDGVLTVSCHLIGTPDSVFEGVTASMGFVDFWNREAPVDGVDANRTVFHVVHH